MGRVADTTVRIEYTEESSIHNAKFQQRHCVGRVADTTVRIEYTEESSWRTQCVNAYFNNDTMWVAWQSRLALSIPLLVVTIIKVRSSLA